MKKFLVFLCAMSFIFGMAASAMAVPFNSNRPLGFGPSMDPPGNTLQDIFNSSISDGTLDAYNDQSNVGVWIPSESDVDAYLITMVKADDGVLGLYSASTGVEVDLNLSNNKIGFLINDVGTLFVDGSDPIEDFGSSFGFYWKNTSNPLMSYTEDDKNGTNGYGGDSNILALSYLVPDDFSILTDAGDGLTVKSSGNDDWILAFEDLPGSSGDGDFNDAVFYVEDMNPVPEPATMLLLGSGLIGLAGLGRKKFFKKS